MVAQAYDPSTQDAETGGSGIPASTIQQVGGQPLLLEMLFQEK